MVNEYGSVGGGGPSAGYSGAGGGSPGSAYTTDPLTASGAAAATVTGGNVVAGQVIAGSYGNDAAYQAAVAASQASVAAGGKASNFNPVGTPEWFNYELERGGSPSANVAVGSKEWWDYQIGMREAAARSNTTLTPISKTTPGYYEFYAPTFPVGTQEWYNQIEEARINEPTGAVAQTPITMETPGYYSYVYPSLTSGSPVYEQATLYGQAQGLVPQSYSMTPVEISPGMYLTGIYGVMPRSEPLNTEIYPGVYLKMLTPINLDAPDVIQTQREHYNELFGIPYVSSFISDTYKTSKAQGETKNLVPETAMIFSGLKSVSDEVSKQISDIGEKGYALTSSLPTREAQGYGNVLVGFGTALAQTAPFIASVPYGLEWAVRNPSAVPSKTTETIFGMGKDILEREAISPGSALGTGLGMYVGGELTGKVTGKVTDYSKSAFEKVTPLGANIETFTSPSGVESNLVAVWTKGFLQPVEMANTRAYIGIKGISEPSMMLSSPSMKTTLGDVKLVKPGEIPTFKSIEDAKSFYESQEGKISNFYHGSSDVNGISFAQNIMKEGVLTVGSESPLYFGKPDTIYSRFLTSKVEYSPGVSSIIRITETPKSVQETLIYRGTPQNPELPAGIYPGTKPLSGIGWKGKLQNEYIVPSKTQLYLKDINYIDIGGSKIPMLDLSLNKPNIIDTIRVYSKQFEYRLNALRLPEYGFGKPTEFIRNIEYKMTNPLEEVAEKQWSPSQKRIMIEYLSDISKEPGFTPSAKTVLTGMKAIPLFREVKFIQREPVGQILAGRELSERTLSNIFKMREQMGSDVVTGGSTTIRANLGKSFIGKELIGDIDAWAKANKIAELQMKEINIISKEQPSVLKSRKPGLQEGFPVAEVRIAGSEKPITEMHSFEAFPAVTKAENIGVMTAIGGAKVSGPTTAFFGGIRKSSATFDKMFFTQKTGEYPKIELNPKSAKHAVGTSAVAKEAASLFYGRDIEKTGMKQSYLKGKLMEDYANSMDKFLSLQKGEALKTINKYQKSIEQNPLELPETKTAKAEAYVKESASLTKLLGVELPSLKLKANEYPIYTNEIVKSKVNDLYIPVLSLKNINEGYPSSIIQNTKNVNLESYPSITPQTKKSSDIGYPNITPIKNDEYPTITPTGITEINYPTIITPPKYPTEYPTTTLPTRSPPNIPQYTPSPPPPSITTTFTTTKKEIQIKLPKTDIWMKRKPKPLKHRPHEQVWQYPFDVVKATELQLGAIKFGWEAGKKTNSMKKNVVSTTPKRGLDIKIKVPTMFAIPVIKTQPKKATTPKTQPVKQVGRVAPPQQKRPMSRPQQTKQPVSVIMNVPSRPLPQTKKMMTQPKIYIPSTSNYVPMNIMKPSTQKKKMKSSTNVRSALF